MPAPRLVRTPLLPLTLRLGARAALLLCALAACAGPRAGSAAAPSAASRELLQAVVDAPDRDPAERALDANRKPVELLAFIAPRPGWRVADLGAGNGYTSELLARSVLPGGVVYAQNPGVFLNGFLKESWPKKLQKPAMQNVVRVDREFDDPLPPEAKGLDAVVFHVVYHDTVWLGADRAKMNKAVFDALKPGGAYVVVDSSAVVGHGDKDAKELHRIDETLVQREVEAAGFKLAEQAGFLRNPQDTRDWNTSPRAAAERRGQGDRFVFKFVKP